MKRCGRGVDAKRGRSKFITIISTDGLGEATIWLPTRNGGAGTERPDWTSTFTSVGETFPVISCLAACYSSVRTHSWWIATELF